MDEVEEALNMVEAMNEVEEAFDEVEEAKNDFGDTFPLVLDHVGLGEGLAHPVHWDGLGRGGGGLV